MKELNEIMRKNLKAARAKAGFSQPEAAKKLNISVHTLSNWEVSPTNVSIAKLAELCQLYGVRVRELLND